MYAIQKRVNFLKNIKRIKLLEHHEIMPSRVKVQLCSAVAKNPHLSFTEVSGIIQELKESRIKNICFVGCEYYSPMILKNILKMARHLRFYITLEIKPKALLKNIKVLSYINRIVLVIEDKQQLNSELFDIIKEKSKSLDISMVLNSHIVSSLDEIYRMMDKLHYDEWYFVRPRGNRNILSKRKMSATINNIIRLNKKHFKNVYVLSPIPFCIDDADRVSKVCIGGFNENGYTDMSIDPRGRIKPDLSQNVFLGTIRSRPLQMCWNSDYMKRVRQFKNVAKMCLYCDHLFVCGGGRIDKTTQFNYFPTDSILKD